MKDYTLYDSIYVTFWKRQSYRYGKQIGGVSVVGGGWLQGNAQGNFYSDGTVPYGTGVVNRWLYVFVHTDKN